MLALPRRTTPLALALAMLVLGVCSSDDGGEAGSDTSGPIDDAEITEPIDVGDLTITLESVSEPYDDAGRRAVDLEVRVEAADAATDVPGVALQCGGGATPIGDGTTYDAFARLGPGEVATGFVVATYPSSCDGPEVVAATVPEVHWPLDLE